MKLWKCIISIIIIIEVSEELYYFPWIGTERVIRGIELTKDLVLPSNISYIYWYLSMTCFARIHTQTPNIEMCNQTEKRNAFPYVRDVSAYLCTFKSKQDNRFHQLQVLTAQCLIQAPGTMPHSTP